MSTVTAPTTKTGVGKLEKVSRKFREVGQRIRFAWTSHTLKGDMASRLLSVMNPFIERGELGRRIVRFFRSLVSPIYTAFKMSKLTRSQTGRFVLVGRTLLYTYKVLGESNEARAKLQALAMRLADLAKNRQLSGRAFKAELENAVFEVVGDKKVASKIINLVNEHVNQGIFIGKNGIVDTLSGIDRGEIVVYSKNGVTPVKVGADPGGYAKALERVKEETGVSLKRTYAEVVLGKIVITSMEKASSIKEAREIFAAEVQKKLASDPLFAKGYGELAWKELRRQYNAGSVVGAFQEMISTLPTRLVSLASRMIANAYRMLPLVGAIAAVNAEAAAAVAELGEGLKNKVEQSAYMWHGLGDLGLGRIQQYIHHQQASGQQGGGGGGGGGTP